MPDYIVCALQNAWEGRKITTEQYTEVRRALASVGLWPDDPADPEAQPMWPVRALVDDGERLEEWRSRFIQP